MKPDADALPADATAWNEFCDGFEAVGGQALEAAPPDPFDRAESLPEVQSRGMKLSELA